MFPKITSLPLGVPRPRMVERAARIRPDVVHLASPALLGYGGLHAARFLGVPTVAVFQTDVAGFAASYGIGCRVPRRVGVDTTSAQPRRPHPGAIDRGDGKPCRAPHPAGTQVGPWRGHHRLRAVGPRRTPARSKWSPDGKPIVGFVGRLAPEKHVERLAVLARRDDLQLVIVGDGVDRAKLETAMPSAIFTGALYGDAARDGVRQHGRLRPPRRTRDVLPGRAGGDGVGPAGHRARRRRTARSRGALPHRPAAAGRRASRPSSANPSTI